MQPLDPVPYGKDSELPVKPLKDFTELESSCQGKRRKRNGFNPWIWKIPWSRKWQPTPVFLAGQSHGQRRLVGCSPWGCEEVDQTETERPRRQCGGRWAASWTSWWEEPTAWGCAPTVAGRGSTPDLEFPGRPGTCESQRDADTGELAREGERARKMKMMKGGRVGKREGGREVRSALNASRSSSNYVGKGHCDRA